MDIFYLLFFHATHAQWKATATTTSPATRKRQAKTRGNKTWEGQPPFWRAAPTTRVDETLLNFIFSIFYYTRLLAASRRQHQRQGYAKHDKRGEMRKKRETLRMVYFYLFIYFSTMRHGTATAPQQQRYGIDSRSTQGNEVKQNKGTGATFSKNCSNKRRRRNAAHGYFYLLFLLLHASLGGVMAPTQRQGYAQHNRKGEMHRRKRTLQQIDIFYLTAKRKQWHTRHGKAGCHSSSVHVSSLMTSSVLIYFI